MNRLNYPLLFVLLLFQCLYAQERSDTLVWPPAPDRARIKHVKTIDSPADLEVETGFFSKVIGFLFGSSKSYKWFIQPVGIAVTDSGMIYVADPGANGVHIIDQKEKKYRFLSDTKFGALKSPVGVALGANGKLYVSDSEQGEVIVFDNDLEAEQVIKDSLSRPTGVLINNDTLFVVDTDRHQVLLYDLNGKFRSSFGKRGDGASEFNFPIALASKNGLHIVDAMNYRVQNFTPSGTFLNAIGRQGTVTGTFASPKSVALDSDGNIYVTDALMDCFQIFNTQGQLLLVVGKNGKRDGEFVGPNGIAINGKDQIYVVDGFNKRIQIFQYIK